MVDRTKFAHNLAKLKNKQIDRAIAFLWYYRHNQQYDERTAGELSLDLKEEGFPEPNVTRLNQQLKNSKYTVKGKRKNSYKLDIRKVDELDQKYYPLINKPIIKPSYNVLPLEWFTATRSYLEQMVEQINGTYEFGWYDSCAVMCRRLMESLIIEVYISKNRQKEIQNNGIFFSLEKLITYIRSDSSLSLNRNTPKYMMEIKNVGDTAAHDRTYITQEIDLDDLKTKYRKVIDELLVLSNIKM
jgi:hypothetical protein